MKNFAHWKNIGVNRGEASRDLASISSARDVITGQIGPENGPIQFILDIPDEATRDVVVAAYLRSIGHRFNEASDGMDFEQEWPPDVRERFRSEKGERRPWSSL
jgi:hypothetical protein